MNHIHHAQLLVGTRQEAELYLRSLCSDLGISLENNPDVVPFLVDTFGIDEARELGILSSRKSLSGRKIFFISPLRLTLEAQNALLKTFEDPSSDTNFLLVIREESLIIPTLLSRMQVRYLTKSIQHTILDEADKFLSLTLKNRLLFVKAFIDRGEDLPSFLDNLLLLLKKNGSSLEVMKRLYTMKNFTHDTACSPRLILEHLSLVLQ